MRHFPRHIHVSLRDTSGNNIFGLTDSVLKSGGRKVEYSDLKYVSQECEWFLGGIVDGVTDGEYQFSNKGGSSTNRRS